MAINSNIRDQAYEFFVEEAPELLQTIESGLLSLRQERDNNTIHSIMRAAHSLKGGSASVGLDAIKAISHRLEAIFKSLYSDSLTIDSALEAQLLAAYDCLRLPLGELFETGAFDAEAALEAAEVILSPLEELCHDAIEQTKDFVPSSSDLGVNMAVSIFEVDVAAGIHRLETVAASAPNDISAELRAQADVFFGFAELLSMPGFAKIAQTIIAALEAYPDRSIEIAEIAIKDLKTGRNAVLKGDTVGGQPSAALEALAATDAADAGPVEDVLNDDALDMAMLGDDALGSGILDDDILDGDILDLDALKAALSDPLAEDELDGIGLSKDELARSGAALDAGALNLDLLSGELSGDRVDGPLDVRSREAKDWDAQDWDAQKLGAQDWHAQNLDAQDWHAQDSVARPPGAEAEPLADIDRDAFSRLILEAAPTPADIAADGEALEASDQPMATITPSEAIALSDNSSAEARGTLGPMGQGLDHRGADESALAENLAEDEGIDIFEAGDRGRNDFKASPKPSQSSKPAATALEPVAPEGVNSDRANSKNQLEDQNGAAQSAEPSISDASIARPATTAPPKPARAPGAKALGSNLTVRVDADRLSRMNNLLGELTINRNGLDLQNTQAQKATRELQKRFERFQDAVEAIRSFSDQLLIMDQHSAKLQRSAPKKPAAAPSRGLQSDFDALEMDRYSTLYSQTQLLLEEIVQLEEAVEDMSLFTRQSGQMLGRHRKMLSQMQDELMWARMLPIGTLLNRFSRMLRDLSNEYEKPVKLMLSGTELLVDKAVLEKLYEPLLHLLRNGFDHGIEPAAERQAKNKPAAGQISVTATYRGRQVIIEVRDDGRGLNSDRIRQRAVQIDLLSSAEAERANAQALHELIFQPGFSTASQVSDLSGRGVGLDVVREQVRELNGRVTVTSVPGEGTAFTLTLPLTLTVLNLLICLVGSTPLAFRSNGITEVVIPKPGQTSRSGGDLFLHWQGKTLRVHQMADLLTYSCLVPEMPPSRVLSAVPSPADWDSPMLILTREKETVALQVDRLVTEQELVVKAFGQAISPPSYAYGCTVLSDGSLVPVIDSAVFLDSIWTRYQDSVTTVNAALRRAVQGTAQQDMVQMTEAVTLLVIDDAVTSRRTLALSLERAGYRVLQARDGQEGVEQLEQNPDVQLIVCDVEMPVMNGFEFLTHRRQAPAIAAIPTVMLTSRSNDKHRWLAEQLGATDYFTKPYLEQEFLKAIKDYIEASETQVVAPVR
ncbi:MAG: response regulator [Elainellaceae cyanobacterium]